MRRRRSPSRSGRRGTLEAERERRFELGEEIDELLADQREVDEQPAFARR